MAIAGYLLSLFEKRGSKWAKLLIRKNFFP